ncbi:MAG: DUF502 domain-containing protein [Planctomycetaceae bacterium]|nr:DUF502 domain-containing protein [Planctomycetales bacterium]MCB9875072.1 DUF502 domain-containing protein [Planctomycetaceae bacterium]MCB9939904.1 DUF502 domain-containing protein [Planctomycetaceae bacterium]HRX79172.1 DUF502 domain-containing protein [Pirellulaceae bacterium]
MSKLLAPLLRRLATYFLAGVFAILPLVITVAVVIWVAGFVDTIVGKGSFLGGLISQLGGNVVEEKSKMAYFIGWVFVLGIVFVLGLLVEMGAKRLLSQLVDALVQKIPLIGSIYGTSKQLVGMLDKKDEADLKRMSVVFCTFGTSGGCGLLALLVSPECYVINGREFQIVIVPTAPVPVGGGLFFVPADNVTPADMSVDGLMSIYVSMGITAPEFLTPVASQK